MDKFITGVEATTFFTPMEPYGPHYPLPASATPPKPTAPASQPTSPTPPRANKEQQGESPADS
ncbi:MAG: hypothetical protein ACYTGH_14280 [Planctomycetota bacterium]